MDAVPGVNPTPYPAAAEEDEEAAAEAYTQKLLANLATQKSVERGAFYGACGGVQLLGVCGGVRYCVGRAALQKQPMLEEVGTCVLAWGLAPRCIVENTTVFAVNVLACGWKGLIGAVEGGQRARPPRSRPGSCLRDLRTCWLHRCRCLH